MRDRLIVELFAAERRFDSGLRSLTAGLFLLTRAAAEGVRVYAVSIVVAIALGTGEVASIAIITALTVIYTFEGGLAAVIWTDVVQTAIYVGGTLVGLFTILHLVPGGWGAIHAAASAAGKLQLDRRPVDVGGLPTAPSKPSDRPRRRRTSRSNRRSIRRRPFMATSRDSRPASTLARSCC